MAAAIGSDVIPPEVHPTGWGTIGQWVGNLLLGGGVGGGVIGALKVWPMIKRIGNERAARESDDRKTDMDDMRKRIADLEAKIERADNIAIQAKMQMAYVTAAFGLVCAELERKDEGNPVIKQAREMVAQASSDDPFGAELRKLAAYKGTPA